MIDKKKGFIQITGQKNQTKDVCLRRLAFGLKDEKASNEKASDEKC